MLTGVPGSWAKRWQESHLALGSTELDLRFREDV
jgi:hypothetical protein